MSALTIPAPIAGLDRPSQAATAARRRTLVGFVATRRAVELVLTVALGVGSGLLFFGSNFGLDMVHTQLGAQTSRSRPKAAPC